MAVKFHIKDMRGICKEPIDCKNCGHLPDQFVEYFDGRSWCSDCAYALGLISREQWLDDEDDNMMAARQYLKEAGRNETTNIKGHP